MIMTEHKGTRILVIDDETNDIIEDSRAMKMVNKKGLLEGKGYTITHSEKFGIEYEKYWVKKNEI